MARISKNEIEHEEIMLKKLYGGEEPKDLTWMERDLDLAGSLIPQFLNRRLSVLKAIFSSMERKEDANWVIVDYGKILSIPEKRLNIIGKIPARMENELFGSIPMLERYLDAVDWDNVLTPMISKYCVDSMSIAANALGGEMGGHEKLIVNASVFGPGGVLEDAVCSPGGGQEKLSEYLSRIGILGHGNKPETDEVDLQESQGESEDQHEDDLIALDACNEDEEALDETACSGDFPSLREPTGPGLQWEGSLLAKVRSLDLIKREAVIEIDEGDQITISLSMKSLRKIADTIKKEGDAPIVLDARVLLESYWCVKSVELTGQIQTEKEMIANSDFL